MTDASSRADRRRWPRRLVIAVLVVAVLLGGAVAVLPWLVDTAAVRRVIEREISTRVGGTVRYDSLALRLFPLPRAEIRGLTVHDPDRLTGRAAVLQVKLSLAALLSGTVRLTAIEVEQPVLEVRLASSTGSAGDPYTVYRDSAGAIVDGLARAMPGMSATIVDGRLDVLRDGQPGLALSKLAVQATVAADAIDMRASAAADQWRAAEGHFRIAPGSLTASAQLQVTGLRVAELLAAIGADGALTVQPGPIDARLEAEADGHGTARATITAASPQLVMERGTRRLELGTARLAADVARDPASLTVSLRHLELGDLLPGATGALRAKADGSDPTLALSISGLDLARVRASALALADDLDAVRSAAEIVRAGSVRSLKLAGSGSTLATLASGVRPTAIDVERPVLELRLDSARVAAAPSRPYRELVGPTVDGLARAVPGLAVAIVDGRLDVFRDRQRVAALSKLAVQATVAAHAIDVRASAAADQWGAAEGHLRIAPGSLAASAQLQATGQPASEMRVAIGGAVPLTARTGPVDTTLEAETDGHRTGRATIAASSPQLVLERGARRIELGATRLDADVAHDPRALTVSLRRLDLGDLLSGASGALRLPASGGSLTFELLVPALDLARVRASALALAGDVTAVRATADIVRAGSLRSLRIANTGPLAALADARTVRAEASLEAGEITLPDLGLAARDGRGALVLANGAVRGSQLSWRIGGSSFRDGALALRLAPEVTLEGLRAGIDVDLGQALAIARRTLDPAAASTLADVEALEGRAAGSVAFEKGGRPDYQVDLTTLAATGRYRGVPFPLAVSAGEVHYTPDALRVRALSGAVGRSRLSGVSAELPLLTSPSTVRAASGEVVLELDELYPWLASLDRLRPALKEVKTIAGTAAIRVTRLSGLLADPDFDATVQPREVRVLLTPLPAPLTLVGGSAQVTPGVLRLDRIGVTLLDGRLTASGTVEDYASPDRRLDVTLAAGAVGAKALDWLRARWKVDPRALPKPPITLDAGRLRWTAAKSSEQSVQGTFRLAGDARAEIDLAWGPETVHLRRFTIKDADSDALGSFRWGPSRASFAYAGRIDHRSIARIMARPPEALTRLQGNFRADIDLVEPRRSTAAGMLAGEGFELLEHWGWPVSIERVRLDAGGNAVTIRDTRVKVAGQRVTVGGSVATRPATFAVDLRAEANRIDVGRLLEAFARDDGGRPAKSSVWDIPAEGRVTVAVKSLALGERVVEAVAGTVRLEPKRAVVDLTQAKLCGVSAPLSVTLTPGVSTVAGRITARGAPLDTVLACVVPGRDLVVTGRLDADGEYAASGPPGELAQRLSGSLRARGRSGRIEYATLWPKIVELESVAEQMVAEEAELLVARGLDYREVALVGTLDAGRARIDRFTLDARALGIGMTGTIDLTAGELALRGVVAPFGNATASLRRIPLLGRLFGARIVGVPFSVSGDWHDPRVRPLGPEAIAGSMLDLLGRVFNAPIRLLTPRRSGY